MSDISYTLTWTDISATAKNQLSYFAPFTYKRILQSVNGSLKSSQLAAILGSTGSGKTSLLDILSGRSPPNLAWSGEILLNGRKRNPNQWRHRIGYVEQFDLFHDHLTVEETIQFAASQRRSKTETQVYKQQRTIEIMKDMSIYAIRDVYMNRIRKSQRKRVNIAIELVSDPKILFLDEPTSGLDSFTAAALLDLLVNVAKKKKIAILMTLHQPKYAMLEPFDEIILLSEGLLAFRGGTAYDALKYFETCGYFVPANVNPADFFVDLLAPNSKSAETKRQSMERIKFFTRRWKRYDPSINPQIFPTPTHLREPPSILVEFKNVLLRDFRQEYRNVEFLLTQLAQVIVYVLILGLTFLQLGFTQAAIMSRVGVVFIIIINVVLTNTHQSVGIFLKEKPQLYKERLTATYRLFPVYISKTIVTVPRTIILNTIYVSSIYWMVGLRDSVDKFLTFWVLFWLAWLAGISLGLAIGASSPNYYIAATMTPVILLVFLVYSGNFANVTTIPPWLGWLIWTSPIQYAFKAALQIEFLGETFECTPHDVECIRTGEEVLQIVNLQYPYQWPCMLALLAFSTVVQTIGFVLLYIQTYPRLKL